MTQTVIIIRGASGCGKSSFAAFLQSLKEDAVICCADDYFVGEDNVYRFQKEGLREAHFCCRNKFIEAVRSQAELIVIANTNSTEKEFRFYHEGAQEFGYQVFFLVLENRHGEVNVHGCPPEAVAMQAKRVQHSLKLV